MDSKDQLPTEATHEAKPQPVVPPTQAVTPAAQPAKPKLDISDGAAQALLMINDLQAKSRPTKKYPTKLLIAAAALILLVVVASILLGTIKSNGASTSSGSGSGIGLPNQSDSGTGSNTTNQINQDVNSCSNPVNAVSVC